MDYLYREKLLAYTRGLQPRNCVVLDVEDDKAAIREAKQLVGVKEKWDLHGLMDLRTGTRDSLR